MNDKTEPLSTVAVDPLVMRLRDAINNFPIIDENPKELLHEALVRIDVLEDWIMGECSCPCCEEIRHCLEGCTFSADDPSGAQQMKDARNVLWGA